MQFTSRFKRIPKYPLDLDDDKITRNFKINYILCMHLFDQSVGCSPVVGNRTIARLFHIVVTFILWSNPSNKKADSTQTWIRPWPHQTTKGEEKKNLSNEKWGSIFSSLHPWQGLGDAAARWLIVYHKNAINWPCISVILYRPHWARDLGLWGRTPVPSCWTFGRADGWTKQLREGLIDSTDGSRRFSVQKIHITTRA